jgi:hypothetical protein
MPTYEPAIASAPVDEIDDEPVYADEPSPASAIVTEPVKPETQSAMMASPQEEIVETLDEPSVQASSIAPPPIEEPPMAPPPMIEEPIVEEVLQQPATTPEAQLTPAPTIAAVSELPAVAPSPVAPIKEDVAPVYNRAAASDRDDAIKSTPSFKAALAAIRAAWGKPARKSEQVDIAVREEAPAASHRIAMPEMALEEIDELPVEISAPVEVDLTGAVEMLDEGAPRAHASTAAEETWVPGPPQERAPMQRAEPEEVYELSVEPDLRELESRFFAPLSPARKQESASTSGPSAPSTVEPRPSEEKRRADSSGERRTKKKRGSKGAKEKAARQQPQPQAQTQAVQDEWGMFDPNRCGFAALVDKLDKVADEKTEQLQKGNKVRVISYS